MDSKATPHSLSPVLMQYLVLIAAFESDLFIGRIKHQNYWHLGSAAILSLPLGDKQAFSRGEISPYGTAFSFV